MVEAILNVPAIAIFGEKKSGKTSLIEAIIRRLTDKGFKVGYVKHIPHPNFTIDKEGKDIREKIIQYFNVLMDETNLQNHKKRLALKSFRSIISRSFLSVKEAYYILTVFHRLHQLIKILKSKAN